MTAGARPGLLHLHRDHGDEIDVATIYVREAHPGEKAPHHESFDQKLAQARRWVEEDEIPWTVAVDDLEGHVHRAFGPLPNSAYLIDSTGQVAFRALWAGQERLLRKKVEELLERERRGEVPANLGEKENLLVPMIHGGAEFDYALARGGEKSVEDFEREMGKPVVALQKLMSMMSGVINPENRDIH